MCFCAWVCVLVYLLCVHMYVCACNVYVYGCGCECVLWLIFACMAVQY